MPLSDFDADEEFEISMVRQFTTDLLPFMKESSCDVATIHLWTTSLLCRSQLWSEHDGREEMDVLAGSKGGKAAVIPVVRERLSKFCLQLMFELCDRRWTVGDTSAVVLSRIASVAAPALLDRCRGILHCWSRDKPLNGTFPFPRYSHHDVFY